MRAQTSGSIAKWVTAACAATFASCLDPTEIVVQLSTDIGCSDVNARGYAVAIGAPGNDSLSPSAVSHDCSSDGGLGSLVVLPSGAGDRVGIRVTLGVDVSIESCDEAHNFAGCIVARRVLAYDPHHPLMLPIELLRACAGVVCDPSSTCFDGTCVDASTPCTGAVCELPDSGPPLVPCTTIPPTPIATLASGVTPRIANIASGYVVSWESKGALEAMTLSADGLPNPAGPKLIATGGTLIAGPLRSDGTSYVAFVGYLGSGNSTPVTVVSGSLTGSSASSGALGSAPLDGFIVDDAGVYEAFFAWQDAGAQGYAVTAPNPTVTPLGPVDPSVPFAAFNTGLSRVGPTTFASYASPTDGTCHALSCTGGSCVTLVNQQACSFVRVAPSGDPDAWAATVYGSGGAALVVGHTTSKLQTTTPLVDVAYPIALIPVATSTGFLALYRDSKHALDVVNAGSTVATPLDTQNYETVPGTGAGFDVVADDPATSRGYAVIYWKSNGSNTTGDIYFTHQCSP